MLPVQKVAILKWELPLLLCLNLHRCRNGGYTGNHVLLHVKLWEAVQFWESEPFTDQQEAVFFVSMFLPSHG